MSKTLVILIAFLGAGPLARAQSSGRTAEADRIVGLWLTVEGKAHVEIIRTGDEFSGSLMWIRDSLKDGKPALDAKNPDESLRTRPVRGLRFLHGFTYDGDDVWTGGRVYDPESGNDYRAKITLENQDTIVLRGYVGIPLFGRSETWTRIRTDQE